MDPTEVATAIEFYNYVQSKENEYKKAYEEEEGDSVTKAMTHHPPASAEQPGRSSAATERAEVQEAPGKTDTSSSACSHIDASSATSSDIAPTQVAVHDGPDKRNNNNNNNDDDEWRQDHQLTQMSQPERASAGLPAEQLFQEYFTKTKPSASAATRWLSLAKVAQEWSTDWFPVLQKSLSDLTAFLPEEIQLELMQECTSHLSGEDKESLQDEIRKPSKRACVVSPLSMAPSAASDPPIMTNFQSPQKASECSGTLRSSSGINDSQSNDMSAAKRSTSDMEDPHSSVLSGSGGKSSSTLVGNKRSRRKSEGVKSDTLRSTPKAKSLALDMVRSITERLLNPSGSYEGLKEVLRVYFELSKSYSGASAEGTMKGCLDTISSADASVVSPSTLHALFLLAYFSITDSVRTVKVLTGNTAQLLDALTEETELPFWSHCVFAVIRYALRQDPHTLPVFSEACRRCQNSTLVFQMVSHVAQDLTNMRSSNCVHFLTALAPHTLEMHSNESDVEASGANKAERIRLIGWLFHETIVSIHQALQTDRKLSSDILQVLVRSVFLGCEAQKETTVVGQVMGMMLYCIVRWFAKTPSRNSAINGGDGLDAKGILPSIDFESVLERIRSSIDISFVQSSLEEEFTFFLKLGSCESEKFIFSKEEITCLYGLFNILLKSVARYATRCICVCVLPTQNMKDDGKVSASMGTLLWNCACSLLTAEPFDNVMSPPFSHECWDEIVHWCRYNGNVSASQDIFTKVLHAMSVFTGIASSFYEFCSTLSAYLHEKCEKQRDHLTRICLANGSMAAVDVLTRVSFSYETTVIQLELGAFALAVGFNPSWYNIMARHREKILRKENFNALARNSGTRSVGEFTLRCVLTIARGRSATEQYGLTDRGFRGSVSSLLLSGCILDSRIVGILTERCLERISNNSASVENRSKWTTFLSDILDTALRLMYSSESMSKDALLNSVRTIVRRVSKKVDPVMRGVSGRRQGQSTPTCESNQTNSFLNLLNDNSNDVLFNLTRVTDVPSLLRGRILSNDLTRSSQFLKLLSSVANVSRNCIRSTDMVEAVFPLIQIYIVVLRALSDYWRGTTSPEPLWSSGSAHGVSVAGTGDVYLHLRLNIHILESLGIMGLTCPTLGEPLKTSEQSSSGGSVISHLLPLLNAQRVSEVCQHVIANVHARLCKVARGIHRSETESLDSSVLTALTDMLRAPDLLEAASIKAQRVRASSDSIFEAYADVHSRVARESGQLRHPTH